MSFINVTTGKSYNFKAPTADLGDITNEVLFPFPETQEVADAAVIALEINAQVTVVNVEELGAAATITATVADEVTAGAVLIVKLACGATARDTTFSTGFEACTVTGVISTTKKAVFIYDGSTFVPTGLAFD